MQRRSNAQKLVALIALVCFPSLFQSLALACMFCHTLKFPNIVLTFSPDSKILASSNSRREFWQGQKFRWEKGTTVELWHVLKGRLKLWKSLPEGQGAFALAFSPDGKLLAVGGSRDNRISLWKLPEGRRVVQFVPPSPKSQIPEYIRSLAFSPDGKLLAAGTCNGMVHLYHLPTKKLLGSLWTPNGLGNIVASLAFSPDGKKLAVLVGETQWFQLWQVSDKRLLWEREHDSVYFRIAFANKGKEIVAVGCSILRCDAASGKAVFVQKAVSPELSCPGGISRDGQLVALWNFDGDVKVCRSSDLKEVWRSSVPGWKLKAKLRAWAQKLEDRLGIKLTRWFSFHFPYPFGFAFSPDGRWLALGFSDGSIHLWKIR